MADEEEVKTVKVLTPKELKKLAKPEFAANPDKFYPTTTLIELGYSRNQCPSCQAWFWRACDTRVTCGDSLCAQKYGFIGVGTGMGRKTPEGTQKKITYAEAYETFRASLTTEPKQAGDPNACTAIQRYPVVARWRDDVDFVQAGIYCFQPYVVTGELAPPANPLICPQFCVRFNDLDNIGITGRHYSGFVMLGIQAFNRKGEEVFEPKDCVKANFRWLTQGLGIDPKEITFIEDVWAGGGNLGPSIEYFVSGLEVGNMVFMQYKTLPDGSREELQIKVIDVGIGLERIPWLVNGSATSYLDVFPTAYKLLVERTQLQLDTAIWEQFGPLSCLLNVDEVDDLAATWANIAEKIGRPVAEVRAAIEPIRDAYVVLDHTRTALMIIQDGALPANTGGGSNVRNVLRRAFAILHKNNWFDKIGGVEGILALCDAHKADLTKLYGAFPEYSSFADIVAREHRLYKSHDEEQRKKLDAILKKLKGAKLSLNDWVNCVTALGIPADLIAQVSGQEVPLNLWYEIDYRQQQMAKAAPAVLYQTANIQPTVSLYDDEHDHRGYTFEGATVVDVLPFKSEENGALTVLVLDKSPFYPTSGGQDHDTGVLTIAGQATDFKVIDALRVGPCVLHILDAPVSSRADVIGKAVSGAVDGARRDQLRVHHTATHLVYAASRKVLGPHVWQNGARKKVTEAHLDITHYAALTQEQLTTIEREVNNMVGGAKKITKNTQAKEVAEKKYGFSLYQGGVVPGNSLRIVDIADTDTEACCGTHCDNTSEVRVVKMIGARRVTDGVVRLTFVAGNRAIEETARLQDTVNALCNNLSVQPEHVVDTATNFFRQAIGLGRRVREQAEAVLRYQCALMCKDERNSKFVVKTDESNAALFISTLPVYAQQLKAQGKSAVFVGDSFVYGFLASPEALDVEAHVTGKLNEGKAAEDAKGAHEGKPVQVVVKKEMVVPVPAAAGEKKAGKAKVEGIAQFTCFQMYAKDKFFANLVQQGFVEM